ncbi:MAG TPA: hypothetical protein VF897_19835 [Roseiflexaceae bacterium]
MPYQHIEEIQSRRGEKIALFLTIENAMGLILAAFPAYLISVAMPFVLRILIVGAAALLGVLATLDVGGMAFYERLAWRVRGYLRQRMSSTTITPEQIAGGAPAVRRDRPLPVGGPVQLRPDAPATTVRLGQRVGERRPEPIVSTVAAPIPQLVQQNGARPATGEGDDALHL